MSKSRRISLPVGPGYRLAVERGANGVGQRPCPVGERPYMEDMSYRQWPFFGNFHRFRGDPEKSGGSRKSGRRRLAWMGWQSRPFKAEARRIFKENSGVAVRPFRREGAIWCLDPPASSAFCQLLLHESFILLVEAHFSRPRREGDRGCGRDGRCSSCSRPRPMRSATRPARARRPRRRDLHAPGLPRRP